MIKYVFFDCDDTLLDFHKAEALALRRTLEAMGLEPTDQLVARYSAINQSCWELLEQKKITRQELLTRRFDILYGELGLRLSSGETQDHYIEFLSQGHFFLPGAPEVLEALWKEYDLYMVSNGTASVQAGRLKSANISHFFKDIFISETVGVNKPQKEFFDYCFSHIPGFASEKAIIVGDSLTSDMLGGNNAGIKTCWYNPAGKPRREDIPVDYEIRDLMELPELLAEI